MAIARHHDVVDSLVSKLENARWVVYKEQELFDDTGRLRRPDIICESKDEPASAFILDLFVAFESPDLLEERRERKLRKYSIAHPYVM